MPSMPSALSARTISDAVLPWQKCLQTAETISIARVIFLMFWTLLIFLLILRGLNWNVCC